MRSRVAAVIRACATGLVVVLLSAVVTAQQQDGFVPATDIGREALPALPLVYAAYAFTWIAVLAYIFLLWQRLTRVEKELREVSARLGAARR